MADCRDDFAPDPQTPLALLPVSGLELLEVDTVWNYLQNRRRNCKIFHLPGESLRDGDYCSAAGSSPSYPMSHDKVCALHIYIATAGAHYDRYAKTLADDDSGDAIRIKEMSIEDRLFNVSRNGLPDRLLCRGRPQPWIDPVRQLPHSRYADIIHRYTCSRLRRMAIRSPRKSWPQRHDACLDLTGHHQVF